MGLSLFNRKWERLVSEDRGRTSAFAIEMLMGERNKIEGIKGYLSKKKAKKPLKRAVFWRAVTIDKCCEYDIIVLNSSDRVIATTQKGMYEKQ